MAYPLIQTNPRVSWLLMFLHRKKTLGKRRYVPTDSVQFSSIAQSCLTLCDSLDCKEIQPVHPKGDQSLVFTGRTDAEAETLILWPPDAKSSLI